jgi:hypothetical protein
MGVEFASRESALGLAELICGELQAANNMMMIEKSSQDESGRVRDAFRKGASGESGWD